MPTPRQKISLVQFPEPFTVPPHGNPFEAGNLILLSPDTINALAVAIAAVSGEKRFVPNTAKPEYRLTVAAAAVGLTLHADTKRVHMRMEGDSARYTLTGASPTAGIPGTGFGMPLFNHDFLWLNDAEAAAIKLIRNSPSTVYFHVIEYKEP